MTTTTSIRLFNSLTKKKETVNPLDGSTVRIYSCGPTVYNRVHLGNLRRYLMDDILVRTLRATHHAVRYIQNVTDVGHLTDDASAGQDKMEESAKTHNKSAAEIADEYFYHYETDSQALNIAKPDRWVKATNHIPEQIAFIEELEKAGYTYTISDGIYFDVAKDPEYGKLINLEVGDLKTGARVEENKEKRNPQDFALWKFSPKDEQRQQEWDSPWGKGFPGWHIECSAMSRKYLGFPFDIHTGGVDNAPTHHVNEIAQNEAVLKSQSVALWMHSEHMIVDGKKMSKSLKNTYTLHDLKRFLMHPLSFRFFALGTHYRKRLDFGWEALAGAQRGYFNIVDSVTRLHALSVQKFSLKSIFARTPDSSYSEDFYTAICDDLNTPRALAVFQAMIDDESLSPNARLLLVEEFDEVLGLGLTDLAKINLQLPASIEEMSKERARARQKKDWDKSDHLRAKLQEKGYVVEDTDSLQLVFRRMEFSM